MAKARARYKVVPIQDCESLSNNKDKEEDIVGIVRSIVDELPVKTKEIVFLRYYNQMNYQQIADVLGISEEAVNGRLRRARKIVAKQLRRQASVKVKL